jgi:protein-disulfide isomerase
MRGLMLPLILRKDKNIMGLYEDRVKRLHDHVIKQQKATEQGQEPTNAELKAKLDELGIEYDKRANKSTLMELLEKAQKEDPDNGEGAE